jgi:sucrose phosphorylase
LNNNVQLITYVDRLSGGGLRELHALLAGPLAGVFGGAHLLPFFLPIDGADAGFDPIDHTQVDPKLGNWDDLSALGRTLSLTADLIVNHVSRDSPQFQDYCRQGSESPYAGMFLTYDRVFPGGATEADLLSIYRPRPGLPFTQITLETGEEHLFWTTFTPQQLDIDVRDARGDAYLEAILDRFQAAGIHVIRLDAVGYAIKKAGTSSFMISETYDFIAELTARARGRGIEVLVEIHSHYLRQIEIARRVDRVYDFALPPLILHTLFRKDCGPLKRWLEISPRNAVTVLDTHDGIGVIDVGADSAGPEPIPGLLSSAEIDELVETIHQRSCGQSKQATGAAASNLDLYQVNCTYYDALGRRDTEYLIARAIQFFAPGVPQVYYVGLLAATNDMDLLARTGVGRDINRHYFHRVEVEAALRKPVVRALIDLIRFRNHHPAFEGEFQLESSVPSRIALLWTNDRHWARLDVDLATLAAAISYTASDRTVSFAVEPRAFEVSAAGAPMEAAPHTNEGPQG